MKGTFSPKRPPFLLKKGVGGGVLIVFLLLSTILLSFLVAGVVEYVVTFKNGLTEQDIDFNYLTNITRNIDVPMYSYVNNFTFVLSKNTTLFNINLTHYYNFEQDVDTTLIDQVGQADSTHNDTEDPNINGIDGYAWSFDRDAVGHYVAIPDDSFPNGTKQRTFNLWVYPHKHSAQMTVWSYGTDFPNQLFQLIYYNVDGKWRIQTSGVDDSSFNVSPSWDSWQMLTVTMNATRINLYVNGTLTNDRISYVASTHRSGDFAIGKAASGTANYYDGGIDELGVWNRSLSHSEVSDLYNDGVGLFYPFATYISNNITVYLNNDSIYTYSGNLSDSPEVHINSTKINDIIKSKCDCFNCTISDRNCTIPIKIHAEVNDTLFLKDINLSYAYGIDNCTHSFNIPSNATALNLSYLDNASNPVTVTHDTYITYYNGNYSQNSQSLQKESYCIYPNWFNGTIDQQIEYQYAGTIYTYFLDDYLFYNTTKKVDLPIQSGTTQVLFTVLDRGSQLEGAYIHVLKYDVGTGTYTTTEILRTDTQGQAVGNIVLATTFYNFLIYYDGDLVYTETGAKLIATTRTFNVNLLGVGFEDNFDTALDVNTNLYYNEDTNNFVFIWSDPTGDTHYGCLRVDKTNDSGKYSLTDNCTESASGTIVHNIAPLSNGTEYIATGYLKYDFEIIVDRVTFTVAKVRDYFRQQPMPSLFIAYLIVLALFLIGIPNPVVSSTLLGLGSIITYMMGMLQVSITQIGAIIILILIQVYLAGRQKE